MNQNRRSFTRRTGTRRFRKLFLIATEGRITEPQYFGMFNSEMAMIHVKCIHSGKGSAPRHVLSCLKQKISEMDLQRNDEAWLVVDKDDWPDQVLMELHSWSETKQNYGLAVSNPKFEWWLLLHFEEGNGVTTPRDCDRHLEQYMQDYDKGIPRSQFTPESIQRAIRRAKDRDRPPCPDWPHEKGTTVYRLVERILGS